MKIHEILNDSEFKGKIPIYIIRMETVNRSLKPKIKITFNKKHNGYEIIQEFYKSKSQIIKLRRL